ncbi:MAG: 50S ribosomal protein L10 [Desulfobulbaceae bacterium]|nr:MAG: 50S ribosomal protein L10 [Desulfobulbaceae bacterium]
MNRQGKVSVVEDLSGKLEKAKIAIVSDYRGLTVSSFEQLRRELKKSNAEIQVAKNTLMRRAIEGTSFEAMQDSLKGTTAVTVSYEDPVSPAKILTTFAKDHPQLVIKMGCLDGKSLSVADLEALSKLPSKEVLLSQLLSAMNGVPTNFVRVLNALPTKLVYALQAVKDQKEQ